MIYENLAVPQKESTPAIILAADLGARNDYTALVAVRQSPQPMARFPGDREVLQYFDVVFMDRFRGVPYPEVAERILSLMIRPELKGITTLVVDATGVGLPVVQTLSELGLSPIALTITGGTKASSDSFLGNGYLVPKRDLYMAATVVLQSGRLRIISHPLKDQLDKELKGFSYKLTKTGKETASNETDELHDDLAMALCMALWYGNKGGSRSLMQIDEDFFDNLGGAKTSYPEWSLNGG